MHFIVWVKIVSLLTLIMIYFLVAFVYFPSETDIKRVTFLY